VSDVAVAGARVRDALARGCADLARAGCETPRLDAEVLLAFVLGVERARLVLDASEPLPADALERYGEVIARRSRREPVAYITGVKEFRRISLGVAPRVLIPRPETELLVEVGLGLAGGMRVADVGTGSGAVALALKDERPDLSIVGIDVSEDSLAVARTNALRLGLDVRFVQANLLDGGAPFDAVLANLPYVASGCATELPPEIALYEPPGALFGGPDGLVLIRRLVPMLSGVEVVALEVGFDQAAAVDALLSEAGFGSISRLRDLAGHERVVLGRR